MIRRNSNSLMGVQSKKQAIKTDLWSKTDKIFSILHLFIRIWEFAFLSKNINSMQPKPWHTKAENLFDKNQNFIFHKSKNIKNYNTSIIEVIRDCTSTVSVTSIGTIRDCTGARDGTSARDCTNITVISRITSNNSNTL